MLLTSYRVNAAQAVSIQLLQSDVAKTQAELLEYREENIRLNRELDKAKQKIAMDNVDTLKLKLEEKVREMNNLLSGWGQPEDGLENEATLRRSSQSFMKRSISYKQVHKTRNFSLASLGAESQLTPIKEANFLLSPW